MFGYKFAISVSEGVNKVIASKSCEPFHAVNL